MQFGLHLGTRGASGTARGVIILAQHLEACGFDYLGFSDHLVIASQVDSVYPYAENGVWFAQDSGFCLDQVSLLSFVAPVTSRIRLLTSVMVAPYRPVMLAAKMLATADVLSGGRLTVGVGAGWMAEEMVLLDAPPFAARGAYTRETMEAFKTLWTEPSPVYAGEHVRFDGLRFEPKPVQKPHPPIWGGGEARAGRRRAAEIADGWYPVTNNPRSPFDTAERYRTGLDEVREFAAAAGRDAGLLHAALLGMGHVLQTRPAGKGPPSKVFSGSPAKVIDDIGAYHDAGLQTLIVGFESDDLEAVKDRISAFAEKVMPAFTPSAPN